MKKCGGFLWEQETDSLEHPRTKMLTRLEMFEHNIWRILTDLIENVDNRLSRLNKEEDWRSLTAPVLVALSIHHKYKWSSKDINTLQSIFLGALFSCTLKLVRDFCIVSSGKIQTTESVLIYFFETVVVFLKILGYFWYCSRKRVFSFSFQFSLTASKVFEIVLGVLVLIFFENLELWKQVWYHYFQPVSND